ncbi:unnamed protein product [Caenorhabditis sp. 36 PRJEB53466]|nr:unnamed protein product [Caenorhabditis sp. 36 PRJEB53466]
MGYPKALPSHISPKKVELVDESETEKKQRERQKKVETASQRASRIKSEGEFAQENGRSLLENGLTRRPGSTVVEAECHVRIRLRSYSIFLIFLAFFIYEYSKFFCRPDTYDVSSEVTYMKAMFNKYETPDYCPNYQKSFRTVLVSFFTFYALKTYHKPWLLFFFGCLLAVFGYEVRNVKLEFAKRYSFVSEHEKRKYAIEMALVYVQHFLVLPFYFGTFFLIRHVHRKSSKSAIEMREEEQERNMDRLKVMLAKEDDYAYYVALERKCKEDKKKNDVEEEKEQKEKFETRERKVEEQQLRLKENEQKKKEEEKKERDIERRRRRRARRMREKQDRLRAEGF